MNKKTKVLLGVGVLAVAAYYFWNKSKESKKTSEFASANGCKYVFGRSISGRAPMVYETCPNKAPRLVRGM